MSIGLGVESIAQQPKPMSDEQLKRFLSSEIQNAMFYLDSSENIAASRYRNWQYYRGVMDDLPSIKGQSSVQSSEVHDYISMMLPSLLRPFTSGDKLFGYAPPEGQDQQVAQTIGRYINEVVFKKDNRGEIILNDWGMTALLQKNGVVKVWWQEDRDFKDEVYQGLTDGEYALKANGLAPNEEISGYERKPAPAGTPIHPVAGAIAQQLGGQPDALPSQYLHDLQITKTINTSRVKIASIPIEEFLISRDARDYDDAILKCHRTWALAGDLIDDGYDATIVNRLPTYQETRSELTRPGSSGREQNRQNIGDPSLRKVMVYEGIVRCNYDGQGVRNWYFKSGGADGGVELLEIEPYDAQIHFCTFCPEPMPNQFVGTCPGDRLTEIQKVNTVLTRQLLQTTYLSNAPQREVVADNILSPDQLSNFAPGSSIMVKVAGSVTPISLPNTALASLECMQWFDSKAADRSGVSRTSAGLDPEALQNQTATAANLAWSASMGRLEMTANIWKYTGMRRLGEALLKTVITYQDFPRAVLLEGKPVTVDPRQWSGFKDMEVTVSTGLGTGHRDRDLVFLNQLLNIQTTWMDRIGPSPVVDFPKLAKTCQRIAEAGGIAAPETVFGNIPDGWAPQQRPPQPSPDVLVKARTDLQKSSMQEQTKQADITAKSQLKLREQDIQTILELIKATLEAGQAHEDRKHEAKMQTNLKTAYVGTGP